MKNYKIVLIFVLVILFSIAFRMPISYDSPQGYDTYVYYKMANDVSQKSYLSWTLSPLSLTGYYPFSYQSGGIIFLSELSLITRMDVSTTILIWSYALIVILFLLIAAIGFKLYNNRYDVIILALVYLNTLLFISYTKWFYSARNLFLVLFLSLILLILSKPKGYRILLILITIVAVITHKLFIILPFVGIAYIFAYYMYRLKNERLRRIILVIAILVFFISSIFLGNYLQTRPENKEIDLVDTSLINSVLNNIYGYVIQFGIFIFIVPIGIFYLIMKKKPTFNEIFIVCLLMCLLPISADPTYITHLMIPILAIFLVYGLSLILSRLKNEIWKIITVISLIIVLVMPLWLSFTPNSGITAQIDIEKYESRTSYITTYLNNIIQPNESVICNTLYEKVDLCNKVTALSTNHVRSLSELSNLIDQDYFAINMSNFTPNIRKLYTFKDPITGWIYTDDIYYNALVKYSINNEQARKILEFKGVKYIISTKNIRSQSNLPNIEKKIGESDRIYSNGFMEVQSINA